MRLRFGILGIALVALGCAVRPFVVQQVEHPGGDDPGQVVIAGTIPQSPAVPPVAEVERQALAVPPVAEVERQALAVPPAAEVERRPLQSDFLEYMRQQENELSGQFVWESTFSGGQVVVLFDFDSAELTRQSQIALSRQAAWLVDHPQARVVLEGHTDARGAARYNEELGERRAASVRDYLVSEGVDAERFVIESRGEGEPLVEGNASAPENRRVVTRVLEN